MGPNHFESAAVVAGTPVVGRAGTAEFEYCFGPAHYCETAGKPDVGRLGMDQRWNIYFPLEQRHDHRDTGTLDEQMAYSNDASIESEHGLVVVVRKANLIEHSYASRINHVLVYAFFSCLLSHTFGVPTVRNIRDHTQSVPVRHCQRHPLLNARYVAATVPFLSLLLILPKRGQCEKRWWRTDGNMTHI
jgi:hypothetical protein